MGDSFRVLLYPILRKPWVHLAMHPRLLRGDRVAVIKLLAPVFLRLADVGLVADPSHLLGLSEELLGLVGVGLLDGEVTNLTEQEVVEVLPVRLLRVE